MGIYKDLKDKRVIVTGGASGIGLAIADRFADEGAKVIILDLDKNALSEALSRNPKLIGGFRADISSENDVKDAFKKADDLICGVDILISNAGISYRKPFMEIEYQKWVKVLRTNLDGMYLCAKQSISRMKEQQKGVILFTASTNGLNGHPLYSDYNASKAGVIVLAKTLALEFAPWLRVNAVCPGYVLTPMQKAEYTSEMMEEVNSKIPMKRHAMPEEIASLYAFLASSEASYITGQAIVIDGGETAGQPMVTKEKK